MSSTSNPDRKVSPALLGLLGVVAVGSFGFLGYTWLAGDDTADIPAPAPVASGTTAPEPQQSGSSPDATPTEDGADSDDDSQTSLNETFEIFNARNPFEQLVDPFGALFVGSPSSNVVTSPTTQASASPSASASASPSQSTSGSSGITGGSGGSTNVGSTNVRLDSVSGNTVTVTVNGTQYTAKTGETFGQRFRVLSVETINNEQCSTMLFGDSRFTLCQGDQVTK